MSIFNIFKKPNYSFNESVLEEVKRNYEQAQEELKAIAKTMNLLDDAYDQYKKDGDIDKVLSVYEKVRFSDGGFKGCGFKRQLLMAKLYEKAGKNDEAWGYLNGLLLDLAKSNSYASYCGHVRYEQFRILKSEGKYIDAIGMLILTHFFKSNSELTSRFEKDKFIKEAKTSAKAANISEEDLNELAETIENKAKRTKVEMGAEKTIRDLYYSFMREKGYL